MNRRMSIAWWLGALLACAACGRQEADRAAASDALMARYKANLLPASAVVPKPGSITVTYLGTAMLLVDDGRTQLLVNPGVSRPARGEAKSDTARIDDTLALLKANRIRAIFVAGAHDRLGDATYIARKTGATLYGPPAALERGRHDGVATTQLIPYAPGETITVGKFRIQQIASKAAPPPKDPSAGPRPGGGTSADFLIRKGSKSILVKSENNFLPGALDHVNADVMFLATGTLADQTPFFQDLYYRQTVGEVRPDLVIPLQWDDASQPISRALAPSAGTPAAFEFLMGRLQQDKIKFGLLQGLQTTELFDAKSCAVPMTSEVPVEGDAVDG